MIRKFTSAFIALFLLSFATPARAAVPLSYYCPASTICSFDDVFGWQWPQVPLPINRDVGDAPRNTCFADNGAGLDTDLIVNNSAYRWQLFRTSSCGGSHIEIAPFTKINPDTGWNSIRAWARTSAKS